MKKYGHILMMVAVLAGLFAVSPLYGQCPMAGKGSCPSGDKGMAKMEMPKFTPEQEKQMMDLKTALLKETDPLKTDLKVKGMELMALWKDDNPDAKKIIAKVEEIGGLKLKLQEKMINHKLAMMKILTPEQKTMMKGMMGMGCDMGGGCGMMGGSGCCGKGMGGDKGMKGCCGGCGAEKGEEGCGGCGK